MIILNNICYDAGGREILRNVSFSVNPGEKVGLVGENGAGKTTLIKIINGDISPTSGTVDTAGTTVGLMPQDLHDYYDYTVRDFVEESTGVKSAREQFDNACKTIERDPREHNMRTYGKALESYDKFDVASFDATLKKSLARAGLEAVAIEQNLGTLSGGERARTALAAIFASHYDTVLLDEPTNNLDQKGVELLENFVTNSKNAFLIVSHDRRFLRNVADRMIELLADGSGVRQYDLGYDEYMAAREKDKRAISARYEQYEKEKKRIARAEKEAKIKANAANSNSMKADHDKLTANFKKERAAGNLASAASGLHSRLHQLEEPERPRDDATLKFAFKENDKKHRNLLSASGLEIDYGNGRHIGPISLSIRSGDKVLLAGDNGSGKTSIIRAIMGQIPSARGEVSLNKDAKLIYVDQKQSLPLPDESALENLRALAPTLETHDAINLLLRFSLKKGVLQTRATELSGGERAKILLAGIAANPAGLLIMDEPTNNLDIATIETLETAIKNYAGGVLLVSHDREFVENISLKTPRFQGVFA